MAALCCRCQHFPESGRGPPERCVDLGQRAVLFARVVQGLRQRTRLYVHFRVQIPTEAAGCFASIAVSLALSGTMCAAGRYGKTSGLVQSSCTGLCSPDYCESSPHVHCCRFVIAANDAPAPFPCRLPAGIKQRDPGSLPHLLAQHRRSRRRHRLPVRRHLLLPCAFWPSQIGWARRCDAGYTLPFSLGQCSPCQRGKYKGGSLSNAACTPCVANANTTATGATSNAQWCAHLVILLVVKFCLFCQPVQRGDVWFSLLLRLPGWVLHGTGACVSGCLCCQC